MKPSKYNIFNEIINEYSNDECSVNKESITTNYPLSKDFQELSGVDSSFLIVNNKTGEVDYKFIKFMFMKSFGQSYFDMITKEIDEEDLWNQIYMLCLQKLLKFDGTKGLTARNYIIGFFNKKLKYHLNKIVYNKKGISFYSYTRLNLQPSRKTIINEQGDKQLIKTKVPLEHNIVESIDNHNRNGIEDEDDYLNRREELYIQEELSIEELQKERIKDDMSMMILGMNEKYGENIMNLFEDYFYGRSDNHKLYKTELGKKYKQLFKEIEEELKENIKSKYNI